MKPKNIYIILLLSIFALIPLLQVISIGGHERFYLKVIVMDNGKPVPSLVYLTAFYPEGFRFISGKKAVDGVAVFWINVNDLKNAWENERKAHGRFALPSFAITVFTNTSKTDFRIITLKWEELKPFILGGYKEIVVKPKHKMKKRILIKPKEEYQEMRMFNFVKLISSLLQPNPPYKPGTYAVLEDYYEESRRVVIFKLKTDPYSEGSIHMQYEAGSTVYVSVDFFLFSVGEWDIGDYLGLSKSDGYNPSPYFVAQNSEVYYSIRATYRWEHWVYYDDITDEKVDECYLVYWCDFDPKSLAFESGDEVDVTYETIVSNKEGNGLPTSGTSVAGIYAEEGEDFNSFEVTCADAGWFIELLANSGKIAEVANFFSLMISVSLKTASYSGFKYSIHIYGEEGMYFNIDRGKSTWEGYTVRYYKVYRVG